MERKVLQPERATPEQPGAPTCEEALVFRGGTKDPVADFAQTLVAQGVLSPEDARKQMEDWRNGVVNRTPDPVSPAPAMEFMTKEGADRDRREHLGQDLAAYSERGVLPNPYRYRGEAALLEYALVRAAEEEPTRSDVLERALERAVGKWGFPLLEAAEYARRTGANLPFLEEALGSVVKLERAGGALARLGDLEAGAIGRLRDVWEGTPGSSERVGKDAMASLENWVNESGPSGHFRLGNIAWILVAARNYGDRAGAAVVRSLTKGPHADRFLFQNFLAHAVKAFRNLGEDPSPAMGPSLQKAFVAGLETDFVYGTPAVRCVSQLFRKPWPELEAEIARRIRDVGGADSIRLAVEYAGAMASIGAKPPSWEVKAVEGALSSMPSRTKEEIAQRLFSAQLADAFLGTQVADGMMDEVLAGGSKNIPSRFEAFGQAVAFRTALAGQRIPSLEAAARGCARTALHYIAGLPRDLLPQAAQAILDQGPLEPPAWSRRRVAGLQEFAAGKSPHPFGVDTFGQPHETVVALGLRTAAAWEAATTPEAKDAVADRAAALLRGNYSGWTVGDSQDFPKILGQRDPLFLETLRERAQKAPRP